MLRSYRRRTLYKHNTVEPGFTNSVQIKGMNSENKVRNEGVAYFDILFYVRTSDGLSKVIINIEAQKSEPNRL